MSRKLGIKLRNMIEIKKTNGTKLRKKRDSGMRKGGRIAHGPNLFTST